MSVVVGAHKLYESEGSQVRHRVQSAVEHPKYSGVTNDIMLLQLNTSIPFNEKVSPICLDGKKFPPGTRCVVTGWGATNG